ncbi:hypothetical protein [Streptomyces sp. NBC_01445]|uniref:hypothetical protein n=1 Tax=Streptomyces sp. NBC_01445 TaxID=2903869 RepID=UPI002DDA30A1|nr:hypothetical protein [Streptomyces sp. NBC_01445]WSE11670.1 hypothetical protein OG574_51855 [Streptomyces sp. NBC_01445]
MNVSELLRLLQAEHDESVARADHLRGQIEQFTAALAEAEARPAPNRPPQNPPPSAGAS